MLIINPVGHCNLPTTRVDAYPYNRLFIILGYFWSTWNCCATSVFSNLNRKTNGSYIKWSPSLTFTQQLQIAISNTITGRHTTPDSSRYCVYSQERDSLVFWKWKQMLYTEWL